ncbi:MAG: sn-glycerol-3-phosphate ABC transporter ATP-binding protein UgpC [Actinomycetota bacterium]|nr:sn-glycerol-3-phosphate ABC transporter ATP-binding protein UgpC [Actinomycetota bacterium]
MAEITFEDVGKVYPGGTRAVEDVDLNIDDGEFVVLVGPSGCGKSTLLRMVAGLEDISEGKIVIGDQVVNDIPPKDRDIAMVFQNYALYPHMSVFDNMGFGLKLRKVSKDEIDRRVREAARVLEIHEFLDRKPRALSGGQRQRVAMGRAIVREPKAFLMDEPLSNLDAKLRVQMRAELGQLHTRLRTTTIYVTHDQVEAMTMGDRVAVIRKGRLQQAATPRELYEEPLNLFVAGFIGSPSMNFVYGRLEGAGDDVNVVIGNQRLEVARQGLASRPGLEDYAGRELIIGIRPEAFEAADAMPGDHSGRTMKIEVGFVEQLGSEAYVHFTLPIKPVMTEDVAELLKDQDTDEAALGDETKFTARVDPDYTPKEGGQSDLVVNTSKLHFFDKDTSQAIYT